MEQWRPVTGYEGFYEVSDQGRVRSLPRQTARGVRGGKILKHYIGEGTHWYPTVGLSRDGTARNRLVHQLVLEAFVGPCPPGMESLHGPGGKTDASVGNLSYGTRSENVGRDRARNGQDNRGERSGQAKLTWDQVREIRRRWRLIADVPIHRRPFDAECQYDLAREFRVCEQTVSLIVNGKTWIEDAPLIS